MVVVGFRMVWSMYEAIFIVTKVMKEKGTAKAGRRERSHKDTKTQRVSTRFQTRLFSVMLWRIRY